MHKYRNSTNREGFFTKLYIFMLTRWRFFSLIIILVCILVTHSLLRRPKYVYEVHRAYNTNANKLVHIYTNKPEDKHVQNVHIPSVIDKKVTQRPLRIGDYEDLLRNMAAKDCKCVKKLEPIIMERDMGLNDSRNNSTSNGNETQIHKTEECTKRRFPRALVVGMTKGGTTALMTFLNNHPAVAARTEFPLDTRYFNYYIESKDLEWYRHLLPCSYSNQVTIEKSTEYFFTPECAGRIKTFDPTMKIIIAVKDPIVRALSQYLMWKDQANFRVGDKTFEQMVTKDNGKKIDGNSRLMIVSNYQKHMKVWLESFSLDQILFVDGHNFVSNPTEEINKVEDFLEIDRHFTKESFVFNSTKGKYCLSLSGGEIDCLEAKKGMAHPTLDKNLRIMLENYFKPLNELFFKMIHRRFDWGY